MGRDAAADMRRIANYYLWKDIQHRASAPGGGPPIPLDLLRQVAALTAGDVPAINDPIGRTEWHVEHILRVARQVMTEQPATLTEETVGRVAEEASRRALARELPVLPYHKGETVIGHVYRVDGQILGCETVLPAVICTCGRYFLARPRVKPTA